MINPKWIAAFEAQDPDKKGSLGVDAFCAAIRSVHPQLSDAQARALRLGVAPNSSGITLAAFHAAAETVSSGEDVAAELAGLSREKFAELGKTQPPPAAISTEEMRERVRHSLIGAYEDGRLEKTLSQISCENAKTKAEDEDLENAALKIQSIHRGRTARLEVEKAKQSDAVQLRTKRHKCWRMRVER